MSNYNDTIEGKRRFKNPDIYKKTLDFQNQMKDLGIAWHNHFADECTIDFACCCGDKDYKHYIPSFRTVIKQAFNDYYEEIKHLDSDGKIKKHIQLFINDNY